MSTKKKEPNNEEHRNEDNERFIIESEIPITHELPVSSLRIPMPPVKPAKEVEASESQDAEKS